MLEIEYKGGNSVNIATKDKVLCVDPNVEILGLKRGKASNAVFLATEKRFMTDVDVDAVQLEGPGEYEAGPFAIKGAAAKRHLDTEGNEKLTTVYHVDISDIRVGVIGNIDPKLSEEQLETIGIVDILVLPVGGNGYTLDAKSATAIVAQVEPKVVIPIHFADSGISYEVPQDGVDAFLTDLGAPVEREAKLKLKSSSSIPQTLTVYVLSRS